MNDTLHLPNLREVGDKPLTQYWLFTSGTATSVGATSSLQLVQASALLPITARSFARVIAAYASISASDTARMLWIDALSLLFTAYDSAGVALGSMPIPIAAPNVLPVNMPALAATSVRFASAQGTERLEIWPNYSMIGNTRPPAQVGLQAVAIMRNTDASAHSAAIAIGGIIGLV